MKRWLAPLIALVILIAAGLFLYFWEEERLEHKFDPQIVASAKRYNVDPALVKAIVWRESRFNAAARGRAGEVGLMQIREIAAQEWADDERITAFDHEHCFDPTTNTLAGTRYLARLLRRYTNTDNAVAYALADYNAGRTYVLKWTNGPAATNSAMFIEQIAFPGTREYVKTVMKRQTNYHEYFLKQEQK